MILTEVFFLTGMYFFLVPAATEEADFLLSPAVSVTRGEPSRLTSVSNTVIVTLLDLLFAGGVETSTSSSACFLFPTDGLADFEGVSVAPPPSSEITSSVGVAAALADFLGLPLVLFGVLSSAMAAVSSLPSDSTSSTRVGRGVTEPRVLDRAVSTSSGVTEVLCLLPLGVRLGVTPDMSPPSGAELRSSADTPEIRLDLLTGVNGCSEPESLAESRLVLLVGVLTASLVGVACFSGVKCLGIADSLSGVEGGFDSTSSREISTVLEDLLALLGVLGLSSALTDLPALFGVLGLSSAFADLPALLGVLGLCSSLEDLLALLGVIGFCSFLEDLLALWGVLGLCSS